MLNESWNKVESGSLTDTILNELKYGYEAKLTGVKVPGYLGKIVLNETKLLANQVKMGKRSEEDVEKFLSTIPNGDYLNGEDLSSILRQSEEELGAALMERDLRNKQAQPVEGYSKGLRKVA